MKSSAWSSRVTWACSGIAAAALVAVPAAAAHVEVIPLRIEPGSEARIIFSVPNETQSTIMRVAIGLPPDFRLGESEAKAGWKTMANSRTIAWEGGEIRPGEFAEFILHVDAPNTIERAVFPVLASLANGRTVTYQPTIEVAAPGTPRDDGARALAEAALVVASAAGLVALGGGFLALWLWLRPRPPDPF